MVGAHYTYSYHLYYLVFQSLGPPLQEERGPQRRLLWGKWGEKMGQHLHLKVVP